MEWNAMPCYVMLSFVMWRCYVCIQVCMCVCMHVSMCVMSCNLQCNAMYCNDLQCTVM